MDTNDNNNNDVGTDNERGYNDIKTVIIIIMVVIKMIIRNNC